MSYPGPPGVSKTASHPSLPPRPPPSKLPGFKPAFSPAAISAPPTSVASGYPAATAASAYPSYGVASAPVGYAAAPTTASYAAAPQMPTVGVPGRGYSTSTDYPQAGYASQQPGYYGGASTASYGTPPQIRNPFPVPGAAPAADFDPEVAAQIAQWQSAYMPKDPSATGTSRAAVSTSAAVTAESSTSGSKGGTTEDKKKTVYREGGGKKWQDDSLLEWDPSHLRLFVGNLAGETTDDSLLKAFSRWKSVQKAKVIRDKRTTKSKGFGFVSFSDPEDFFQAAKEMNGKYIQSHPVVVHKAKTEIKPAVVKDDRKKDKNKKKSGNASGSGRGGGGHHDGYEPHLGPVGGGGVTKPGQKTRGGLKLLG
ncbi:RNA-binding protein 42 [Echria macrotheca]|uniref:RNA-binding protein 42 n=1 Tax=Echria macrotheca TaxID=438768 RepID=A0AAJ0BHT6_9PEZI|nr:RNA-binding protein 42 [Echria macrotheca]